MSVGTIITNAESSVFSCAWNMFRLFIHASFASMLVGFSLSLSNIMLFRTYTLSTYVGLPFASGKPSILFDGSKYRVSLFTRYSLKVFTSPLNLMYSYRLKRNSLCESRTCSRPLRAPMFFSTMCDFCSLLSS